MVQLPNVRKSTTRSVCMTKKKNEKKTGVVCCAVSALQRRWAGVATGVVLGGGSLAKSLGALLTLLECFQE